MRPYVVRPAAARDIRSAYLWYEGEREGLGEEFLVEVRAALEAVLEGPELHPVLHRETRRALVHRFPYGLFLPNHGRNDRVRLLHAYAQKPCDLEATIVR